MNGVAYAVLIPLSRRPYSWPYTHFPLKLISRLSVIWPLHFLCHFQTPAMVYVNCHWVSSFIPRSLLDSVATSRECIRRWDAPLFFATSGSLSARKTLLAFTLLSWLASRIEPLPSALFRRIEVIPCSISGICELFLRYIRFLFSWLVSSGGILPLPQVCFGCTCAQETMTSKGVEESLQTLA